jgi:hypothetical protein
MSLGRRQQRKTQDLGLCRCARQLQAKMDGRRGIVRRARKNVEVVEEGLSFGVVVRAIFQGSLLAEIRHQAPQRPVPRFHAT